LDVIKSVFLGCTRAIEDGVPIARVSATDKEFSFQNWVADRLDALGLNYDEPSRNSYPDFRLVDYPIGFEVKGLGFPGREANYDCNSQVPTGLHNGRAIYYVFGRYPSKVRENTYPVYDMVICHGDFLNADHGYIHKNKNLKTFGSYGDIMIRDRKMYVAPTPFALASGTERQVTLIVPPLDGHGSEITSVGTLARKEVDLLVRGYSFDMLTHDLKATHAKNPNAGVAHDFVAYRSVKTRGPDVSLR